VPTVLITDSVFAIVDGLPIWISMTNSDYVVEEIAKEVEILIVTVSVAIQDSLFSRPDSMLSKFLPSTPLCVHSLRRNTPRSIASKALIRKCGTLLF